MKKAIVLFLLLPVISFAQTDSIPSKLSKFSIGLYSMPYIYISNNHAKFNVIYGIMSNYSFSNRFAVQTGILFSNSTSKGSDPDIPNHTMETKISSIEVPLIIHYRIFQSKGKHTIYLLAGLINDFTFRYKQIDYIDGKKYETIYKRFYHDITLAQIALGVVFQPTEKFSINIEPVFRFDRYLFVNKRYELGLGAGINYNF